MKIIIAILAVFALSMAAQAQSIVKPMTVASASITNTGTATLTATSVATEGNIAFQVNVTKVSGTVAGKSYLYGSLDNTNFKRVGGADSLVLTDQATNVGLFHLLPNKFQYYQIRTVGSGTMVATHAGYYLSR